MSHCAARAEFSFSRLAALLIVALLALPSNAAAQRDAFFSALLNFYRALGGVYGDEGPQLSAHLEAMSAALNKWDEEIRDWERQVRPRLQGADAQTSLQVHTFLASLYIERGRYDDALRELDEDIRIDPQRAAFPRLKGLVYQMAGRSDAAADAFWAAWQLDPADPQNAYRLIAFRSGLTTDRERALALDTLRKVERGLVRELAKGAQPAAMPFVIVNGLNDDAGGAMAFVPAAYAPGFSLVLAGNLAGGVAALRSALAADPLVADGAIRTPAIGQALAALKQGRVSDSIDQIGAAINRAAASSEAHRMLATAYGVSGQIQRSLEQLREAVRLNPRDERSWTALARTVEQTGTVVEAQQVVRDALAALPDAAALRWQLAELAARDQRTVAADVALIAAVDRYVLIAGRGDLHAALARFARTQLDFAQTIALLERAIALAPNNTAAHKALARAYMDEGREDQSYAELVVALMLKPDDEDVHIELGSLHLAAGRLDEAVEILERTRPTRPAHVRTLGEALIRAGRTADGESRLREAERLQAEATEEERRARTAATLMLEAEVRMTERDFNRAIALWREIVAAKRASARTHMRLGDALVAAGRLDEGAASYQTAVSAGAGAEAQRRLADVYDALGRREDGGRERASYVSRRLEELRQRASGVVR